MINEELKKEKLKKAKKRQDFINEIRAYCRTAAISFGVALIITVLILIHARSEMIKNLYIHAEEKSKIEKELAKQIIEQSNLAEELSTKNSLLCMYVGDLYEAAGDFENAQFAYRLSASRAKKGNYKPYYKLITLLANYEKFDDANEILDSIPDTKSVSLIKFKTRAYIIIGDKYYSIGKFLKASANYERAMYYYNRFKKNDPKIVNAIKNRIVNSYIKTADVIVKNGYNSDAVRFLKKARELDPDNFKIKYKLAVIYADLDPIISVNYFEPLLEKMPQDIDYNTYNKVLIKAANIEDLQGNTAKAKYYRYRIHTIDLFIKNKVIYRDDVQIILNSYDIKKIFFRYKIKLKLKFKNESASDIYKMSADFILKNGDKIKETHTIDIANKKSPLISNGDESDLFTVNFGKNIFTRKELNNYTIEIYLYKDKRYKTFMGSYSIPKESNKNFIKFIPYEFLD